MINMIKCSLCGWSINDSDELIKERKLRHEEHHNGSLKRATYNIIRGNVEWLNVR